MSAANARGGGAEAVHHYVSERQKRQKQRAPASMQPPLTPMIDVVFQLLLFFLLACRFVQFEGQLRANLPNVSGPQIVQPLKLEPIKVLLSPEGQRDENVVIQIDVQQGLVLRDVSKLYGELDHLREKFTEKAPVIIAPRGRVRWKYVVDAFNQAIRAKFKNIGFAPPEA